MSGPAGFAAATTTGTRGRARSPCRDPGARPAAEPGDRSCLLSRLLEEFTLFSRQRVEKPKWQAVAVSFHARLGLRGAGFAIQASRSLARPVVAGDILGVEPDRVSIGSHL